MSFYTILTTKTLSYYSVYVLKAYLQKKQKELDDAIEFHEKNFQDCIDVNQDNHYLISEVITDIRNNYPFTYPRRSFIWQLVLQKDGIRLDPQLSGRLYRKKRIDFSWTPLYVSDRIKIYNDPVEKYKENTKLQRCGYQY